MSGYTYPLYNVPVYPSSAALPSDPGTLSLALTRDTVTVYIYDLVAASWKICASPSTIINPMTTAGDLIYGGVSGAPTRLAAGTAAQFLLSGTAPVWTTLSGDATLASNGALTLAPSILVQSAVISLSQSDITGLSVTPKVLVAAPGSGKLIVVQSVEFLHTYSTTAYANGGDLTVLYHGSTTIAIADEDVVNGGSSANYFYTPSFYDLAASADPALNAMTALANLGIDLTNATAAFINGNAANILKVKVTYRVITLMT